MTEMSLALAQHRGRGGGDSDTTGTSGAIGERGVGAFLRHSDGGKDTSHITKKEGQIAIQLGKGTITALFPLQLDYLKELNNKEDCTEVTLGILKKNKKSQKLHLDQSYIISLCLQNMVTGHQVEFIILVHQPKILPEIAKEIEERKRRIRCGP